MEVQPVAALIALTGFFLLATGDEFEVRRICNNPNSHVPATRRDSHKHADFVKRKYLDRAALDGADFSERA